MCIGEKLPSAFPGAQKKIGKPNAFQESFPTGALLVRWAFPPPSLSPSLPSPRAPAAHPFPPSFSSARALLPRKKGGGRGGRSHQMQKRRVLSRVNKRASVRGRKERTGRIVPAHAKNGLRGCSIGPPPPPPPPPGIGETGRRGERDGGALEPLKRSHYPSIRTPSSPILNSYFLYRDDGTRFMIR